MGVGSFFSEGGGRQGDKETRRQGDKETRKQGDKETRRQGNKETRRQGNRETGRRVFPTLARCFLSRTSTWGTMPVVVLDGALAVPCTRNPL